ncbi:hypothetical protein [Rhodopseudomonas pseudopalustris]|uniref:Uncharacterized protein n=1 Tax=Rhodopseudomonas pseudopalustris TaxID=1513892 RepID=A0A1H8UVM1_9BRAD|nr:hypothetical protein [Rhodopseudomonas pseudopalustris]SEP07191.1 hypothetical protein SAMN05444123_107269 [Rhodopseudomonas pseudopalustris]
MIVLSAALSLPRFARLAALALTACLLAAAPARADRCDDLAAQLKSQIDGITIGKTIANVIYLSHPAAKSLRLGCPNRTIKNEVFGIAPTRQPSPAFQELIASAAAIVFTIPKPDTLRGVKRCFGRIGLLRGNDVKSRYRRLDIRCIRGKADSSIAVSRSNAE